MEPLEADCERQRELRQTQQLHGSLLHTILRAVNGASSSASSVRLPEGISLPLATMEEFARLEEKLSVDDEYTEALVSLKKGKCRHANAMPPHLPKIILRQGHACEHVTNEQGNSVTILRIDLSAYVGRCEINWPVEWGSCIRPLVFYSSTVYWFKDHRLVNSFYPSTSYFTFSVQALHLGDKGGVSVSDCVHYTWHR